ncbi:MAG: histidine phosphatase family protein [Planctomycetaceae bacterium]
MSGKLLLVRHPPVAAEYRPCCYGQLDVPLSPEGEAMIPGLVEQLAAYPVARVWHSGLQRATAVAVALAERLQLAPLLEPRLKERHFGDWEGVPWSQIFQTSGDAMLKMISEPDTWTPAGGETTYAVRDRVLDWYAGLPVGECLVAIAHGGVICSLRGALAGLPVADWIPLIPPCGEVIELPLGLPYPPPGPRSAEQENPATRPHGD